ncbi:hypothetical protein ALC62_01103 [Cyphomyrmex costatus]|uniref:Uncharacterized protein n=1 Tax=Cyphomyrmex costatus TaxID=456900 RepID=A0A195D4Z6_9HYME|nr:hypothetical protein ALC62_01103 [Cyphomyrmex costatus]
MEKTSEWKWQGGETRSGRSFDNLGHAASRSGTDGIITDEKLGPVNLEEQRRGARGTQRMTKLTTRPSHSRENFATNVLPLDRCDGLKKVSPLFCFFMSVTFPDFSLFLRHFYYKKDIRCICIYTFLYCHINLMHAVVTHVVRLCDSKLALKHECALSSTVCLSLDHHLPNPSALTPDSRRYARVAHIHPRRRTLPINAQRSALGRAGRYLYLAQFRY